jgi:hypothetical protein
MSDVIKRSSILLLALFSSFAAACGGGGSSTPPPPPPPAAPTVVSTAPADMATAVSLSTVVTATFSTALDASTISATTFTLTGPGTTAITGTVTASGSTATFTPAAPLTASTLFTATVTTGVKSQAGIALAANHVWTFTTASAATGNFSNADLTGQFAFSVHGRELCGSGQGAVSLFARVGTFISDGNGNITSGLEDVNTCTGAQTLSFTSGTYSIGGDGRGTVSLVSSTGTTLYTVALGSSTQGFIAPTDANTTANGSFQKQTPGDFSTAKITGGYVFEFKGIDATSTPTPASFIGRFNADGAGGITGSLFDSDIGGSLSGQLPFPSGAVYHLDSGSNGSTFGRGTATLAGQNFAFYIVDATHLKLLGTGSPSEYLGDAFKQSTASFDLTSVIHSYAFQLSGTTSSGGVGTAGRFDADGAGNITNVVTDENNSGSLTLLPKGTTTGSYTVDANHLGGGTLTLTDTTAGTFTFIFYLASPTQAVIQETDTNFVSDGTFSSQTTTAITATSLAGDYAFGLTGANNDEQQFVGQLTLTPAGTFTGQTYFSHIVTVLNQFTTNQQFTDVPINGTLVLSTGGTGANALTVNLQITSPDTFQFSVYVVDQNKLLLIGSDTNRVVVGTLTRQQ